MCRDTSMDAFKCILNQIKALQVADRLFPISHSVYGFLEVRSVNSDRKHALKIFLAWGGGVYAPDQEDSEYGAVFGAVKICLPPRSAHSSNLKRATHTCASVYFLIGKTDILKKIQKNNAPTRGYSKLIWTKRRNKKTWRKWGAAVGEIARMLVKLASISRLAEPVYPDIYKRHFSHHMRNTHAYSDRK